MCGLVKFLLHVAWIPNYSQHLLEGFAGLHALGAFVADVPLVVQLQPYFLAQGIQSVRGSEWEAAIVAQQQVRHLNRGHIEPWLGVVQQRVLLHAQVSVLAVSRVLVECLRRDVFQDVRLPQQLRLRVQDPELVRVELTFQRLNRDERIRTSREIEDCRLLRLLA